LVAKRPPSLVVALTSRKKKRLRPAAQELIHDLDGVI
jgi:hypothetical protein